MPSYSKDLLSAWELFLEELDVAIGIIRDSGARALSAGNYDEAQRATESARTVQGLREEFIALWTRVETALEGRLHAPKGSDTKRRRGRRTSRQAGQHHRLERGLKTHDRAYRVPVLTALVEMGGSAPASAVLERVYHMMQDRFNEYDLAAVPSGGEKRWRKTAQWCRNTMKNEGLLRSDSPRGIWEITDEGRRWLAEHRQG